MNLNYSVWIYIDTKQESPQIESACRNPTWLGDGVVILEVIERSYSVDDVRDALTKKADDILVKSLADAKFIEEFAEKIRSSQDEAGN